MGVWNENPTSLSIRIIPPLWFRWYAFLFYGLVVISIIILCRSLKNNITTSHIPVILLNALNSINDKLKGLDPGTDAYISKPFSDELLLAQIRNLLHSGEALRQLFNASSDEWKHKYSPEDIDQKFLLKSIEIVINNMENEFFSAEEFAQEMNLSRAHLQKRLSRPVETTSL